jgi:hypothetical protein
LPTDFGFVIVHAHEPEAVYVVPIKATRAHVHDAKLRVFRSKTGGNEGGADQRVATKRLLCNVLRDAMELIRSTSAACTLEQRADRFTHLLMGRQLNPIVRDFCSVVGRVRTHHDSRGSSAAPARALRMLNTKHVR